MIDKNEMKKNKIRMKRQAMNWELSLQHILLTIN